MSKTFEEDCLTLEKLMDDWEIDSVMDRSAPSDDEAKRRSHHTKYLRVYTASKIAIAKAVADLDKIRRIRTAYYDGSLSKEELDAHGWEPYLGKSPKTITQREELVNSDPLVVEVAKRKYVYETMVDAAQNILSEIRTRGYTIKSFIDWELAVRNG